MGEYARWEFFKVLFQQVQQIHRMILLRNSWQYATSKQSNSCLVHYRPYQGAKKGIQAVSFTKCGLRDNVVLRLMQCLTPTVSFDLLMDNYFRSLRLFFAYPPWS